MPRPPVNPDVAKSQMIAKGVWPVEAFRSPHDPWLCVCMVCEEWVRPRLANVRKPGRGGCRECAKKASAASRRIPEKDAVAEMRAAGLEPLAPYRRVDEPW